MSEQRLNLIEAQETVEEYANPVELGNNNQLNNSTLHNGVTLGEYNHLNHCYIDGTIELGNNCILTGCVVHSNDNAGFTITGTGNMIGVDFGGNRTPQFTDKVISKAWKLLEEYMTASQYFAFMEGTKIELENKTEDFRLLVDKKGDFNILEGKRGSGIVASSGRIRSHDYPLGDEIAAFLDWFNHKTRELISQWNCGTYGIVKEGERR